MLPFPSIEAAIAHEAAAHANASAALNPYGEAEAQEIGRGWMVYSGAISPIHGVYGLGLDGPVEENDWREIDRFFSRKERAPNFWLTPFTDPTLLETIRHTHKSTQTISVRGIALEDPGETSDSPFSSGPDHEEWAKAFKNRGELLALTKLHQKHTRFYLADGQASYTFFHQGIALVPFPNQETLPLQLKEHFHSKAFIVMGNEIDLPLLYERVLYEPV